MGDLTAIKQAVEARMVVLTFVKSNEKFDFEDVPNSVIDKAFIVSVSRGENEYLSGNLSNPKDILEILIAYKTKRNERVVGDIAIDDRETIEVDIINHASITGLDTDPLLILNQEAESEKLLEHYLVSRLGFTVDYIRDVSP